MSTIKRLELVNKIKELQAYVYQLKVKYFIDTLNETTLSDKEYLERLYDLF